MGSSRTHRRLSRRARDRVGTEELATRLEQQQTTFKGWHLREPLLLFGRGGQVTDPKTGIVLHGPWGTTESPPLSHIRLGIVGTSDTIGPAQHWLERCRQEVRPSTTESPVDPILFPSFPGMESAQGFQCRLEVPNQLIETLTPGEVARCLAAPDRDHAVEATARIIGQRLQVLAEKDGPPQIVLVALPREIRSAAGSGRSPSRVAARSFRKADAQLRLSFLDERHIGLDSIPSRTLHRAIKGEGMRFGLPTQLAWPSTFSGGDGVEDDGTRAWNFCTGLYYKAGGVPWRSSGLARNTCYVGISFFRPLGEPGLLQTSMAQAFSDRGEGLVLRGESFQWDTRTRGPARLSREHARRLLTDVLATYSLHHRQRPVRVVVHKSSEFDAEEIAGMKDALGSDIPYFDFLSVSKSDIRFMRMGSEPPLRGTAIEVAAREYIFYTRGYIPFLRVYPGLRIPRPLRVSHHTGSAAVTEVLAEILALTKINWNSAAFGAAEPITLGFARDVGLILGELPADIQPRQQYRFYM